MASIDAVSVAVPPLHQADIVCESLAAGKHVLCEKPFGIDLNEAGRMFESARKHQRVNAIDFEYRMERGIAELKQQMDLGAIGALRRIHVMWHTRGRSHPSSPWSWQHDLDLGGGVLNNFGSHVLDYVEWLSGCRILSLFARAGISRHERPDTSGVQKEVTAEDNADLLCEMESGVVASLSLSNGYSCASGHRIEMIGDRGRLCYIHEIPSAINQAQLLIETDGGQVRSLPLRQDLPDGFCDPRAVSFRRLAGRFIETISGSSIADLPDFERGLRVRTVLDAARRSIRCREAVTVPTSVPPYGDVKERSIFRYEKTDFKV